MTQKARKPISIQAGNSSVREMKQHLDTDQLRALRRGYTSIQYNKEVAIEEMIKHWGAGAVASLNLEKYSNMSLRSSVKVAELVVMDEADALLSKIALRRLRSNKPGRGSVRGITTGDWQDLVVALASDEAKIELSRMTVLTDDEQNWFGITESLSIFGERVSAAPFSYGRRGLRESDLHQTRDNANELDLSCDTNQVAKRARIHQRYSCLLGHSKLATSNILIVAPQI